VTDTADSLVSRGKTVTVVDDHVIFVEVTTIADLDGLEAGTADPSPLGEKGRTALALLGLALHPLIPSDTGATRKRRAEEPVSDTRHGVSDARQVAKRNGPSASGPNLRQRVAEA
jgi:hypothetical protein